MNNKIINILMIISFFMYVLGAAFSEYLALFAFVLTIFLIVNCDRQKILELCALLAPIAAIMKFKSDISLFNFIYLISLAVFIYEDNMKIRKNEIIFALIVILEGTYSICINGFGILNTILSFCIGMFFMSEVLSKKYDYNISEIVEKFSFSLIASAVLEHFSAFLPGIDKYLRFSRIKLETGEKVGRLSGFIGNPNYFSLALNIAIISFLVLMITKKEKKINYIYVVLLSIIGIYTLSKSFFIAFLASILIIYIYLFSKYPKKFLKFSLVILLFMIINYFIIDFSYLKILLDRIDYSRFNNVNEFTTHRIDKFTLYLNYIFNDTRVLLFGDGIYNSIGTEASHSFYIELIYYYGIIGTIILLLSFLNIIKDRIKRVDLIYIFPLIIYMLRGVAINLVTSIIFPMYMIIIFLFVMEGEKKYEKKE